MSSPIRSRTTKTKLDPNAAVVERSLSYFTTTHPFRKLCLKIVRSKAFEFSVIGLILANCFFLALTNPFASCCTTEQVEQGLAINLTDYSVSCNVDNFLVLRDTGEITSQTCCIDPAIISEEDVFSHVICANQRIKDAQRVAETIFNILFTMELIVKVIAFGFVRGKGTYLHDGWNWLDFVVVVVGWLSELPGVDNLTALRTFRVLRPLRTLSSVPGMRPIVKSIISSLPAMIQVGVLCIFLFVLFGVVGLQLFRGLLTGRCHYVDPTSNGDYVAPTPTFTDAFRMFSIYENDEAPCPLPCFDASLYSSQDPELVESIAQGNPWSRVGSCLSVSGITCGDRGKIVIENPFYVARADKNNDTTQSDTSTVLKTYDLPLGQQLWEGSTQHTQQYDRSKPYVEVPTFCLDTGQNQLGSGWANFDNFGSACLTIFTSITLEGWVDVMYGVQATFGYPVLVFAYFCLMVLLCAFFMLELTLAVINDEYDKAMLEEERKAQELYNKHIQEEQERIDNGEIIVDGLIGPHGEHLPEKKHHILPWEKKPWGSAPFRKVYALVESPAFNNAITTLIVLNTITLAMEHYNMSDELSTFLEYCNVVFTIAFLAEMILKLVGLGIRGYLCDSLNIFDCVIVFTSMAELLFFPAGAKSGLSALRSFRLMRVFKLARSWHNLRVLLSTILLSILDVGNVSILLAIIMFIFTLLGMQLFGGQWTGEKFCENPDNYAECRLETPRANFDTIGWGLVTVFQVLTGENWNELMYIGLTASGQISWVFFTLLQLVGNYMVLNLFLAILLARFDDDSNDEDNEDVEDMEHNNTSQEASPDPKSGSTRVAPLPEESTHVVDPVGTSAKDTNNANNKAAESSSNGAEPLANVNKIGKLNGKSCFMFPTNNKLRVAVYNLICHDYFDRFILVLISVSTVLLAIDEPWLETCSDIPAGEELNGIPSCYTLAMFLTISDYILNTLFIGEMLLKMFALGVVLHKDSYLRDGWNIVDFVVVVISVISMVLSEAGAIKALRSMRSLRALRPLRVVSRAPGMKLVVNSIIWALPAILNVTMVCILFFLILAITGVQNFMGGMNSCNDPNVEGVTMEACVGYNNTTPESLRPLVPWTWVPTHDSCAVLPTPEMFETCLKNGTGGCATCYHGGGFPRLWQPTPYNFDHVGNALLVVFEVSSGEMWPDIMYSTMDVVGTDEPMRSWPHQEGKMVALWFIAVTLICAFLMLNVLVGVIIDNFNDMKEKQNGSVLLTDEQKVWIETMKLSISQKPLRKMEPPEHPARVAVWNITQSRTFEFVIMVAIILNTVTMCLQYEGQSEEYDETLDSINLVFTIVFSIEAAMKLIAMDKKYFSEGWNIFDFTLVLLSIGGLVGGVGSIASLFRVFRVARIFRLIRTSQGLLNHFRTLIYSIPSIWNVGAILLLLMLIFAIMGMNLFANIKHGDFLNENANFETFWGSMSTLFRMATGESFNGIMHDCMIQEPYCSNEYGNCGYVIIAPLYFCVYFVLSGYILLSMITAIILDNASDTQALAMNTVTEAQIDAFKEAWAQLDPKGTMLLDEVLLVRLLQCVPYPLGVKDFPDQITKAGRKLHIEPPAPSGSRKKRVSQATEERLSQRKRANRLIQELDIPSINGKVAFSDVLTELTQHAMPGIEVPLENHVVKSIAKKKDEKQGQFLMRMGTTKENVMYTAAHSNGILIVQSAMRGFIYRRTIDTLKERMISKGVIKKETLDANIAKITNG